MVRTWWQAKSPMEDRMTATGQENGRQHDETGKQENRTTATEQTDRMKRRSKVDMAKKKTLTSQNPHWSHFAVYSKRDRPALVTYLAITSNDTPITPQV